MISKCKKYFEIEEQFLSILEKERILFTNYIILDRGEIIEKWLLKRGIFWKKWSLNHCGGGGSKRLFQNTKIEYSLFFPK